MDQALSHNLTPPEWIQSQIDAGAEKQARIEAQERAAWEDRQRFINATWRHYYDQVRSHLPENIRPFALPAYGDRFKEQPVVSEINWAYEDLILEIPGLAHIAVMVMSSGEVSYSTPTAWSIDDFGDGEEIYYTFSQNAFHTEDLQIALVRARRYYEDVAGVLARQTAEPDTAPVDAGDDPLFHLVGDHNPIKLYVAVTNLLREGWMLHGQPFAMDGSIYQALTRNYEPLFSAVLDEPIVMGKTVDLDQVLEMAGKDANTALS